MSDLWRLLVVPVVVVTACTLARRNTDLANRAVRLLAIMVGALLLGLAVSGWWPREATAQSIHRWTGHATVIAAWLLAPITMGVAIGQIRLRGIGFAAVRVLVALTLLAAALLGSLTGYLADANGQGMPEETSNRFTVLHLYALPALTAALLGVLYWQFRRQAPRQPVRRTAMPEH